MRISFALPEAARFIARRAADFAGAGPDALLPEDIELIEAAR
jgi:hypothetical protein